MPDLRLAATQALDAYDAHEPLAIVMEDLRAALAEQPAEQEPVEQAKPSPTSGMNIAQRILHVGGRNNAAGYVEFGSIQAVEALVRQVIRDLPQPAKPADQEPVAWQGGLDNEELLEWWGEKAPGVKPTDKELTAFALGVEVGCIGSHSYFLERNSARDAWRRAANERDKLRIALAERKEPQLTVDALRVEFEKRHRGTIGTTRIASGEYLSPAIETEWQQFVRKYTAPQPRKRLTDQEIDAVWDTVPQTQFWWRRYARAIERAHGIGEQE